jgi:hypothetical protein
MNETQVEIGLALFFDTQYPQCVNELRRIMVWVLYKDFEELHRRRSSIYWMSLLGKRLGEKRMKQDSKTKCKANPVE